QYRKTLQAWSERQPSYAGGEDTCRLTEYCTPLVVTSLDIRIDTYHAKLPMSATNLSRSSAPPQEMSAVARTTKHRKIFFCHFTKGFALPLRVKIPFSMIRIAGKSWRGVERRIASE